ncbi:MAG: FUSC family protein [Rhodospirillaceae bacterium]|nr:MAG: FUSC family protein [Rhodospirillaceae bacterium]
MLAAAFNLPQGYWAVFTAVLVTQSSVGGSVTTGIDRLIGTVGGVAYSVLIATTMPHETLPDMTLAIAAALLPLTFLAALNTSFRVAPVTAIILLLAPASGIGPLTAAVDRVFEIGLGSVVGIVVSLLVFPARAHALVTTAAAETLLLYARLLATLLDRAAGAEALDVTARHNVIRAALTRVETLAAEARRERSSRLTLDPDTAPLARTLRRLRSDLVIIDRAVTTALPPTLKERLVPAIGAVAQAAVGFLTACAAALKARRDPPALDAVEAALRAYAATIGAVRREGLMRDTSDEQLSRIFTLGFALDQLRQNLRDLASRTTEFTKG